MHKEQDRLLFLKHYNIQFLYIKGRSHMRPRMDFHLVLRGEYL